MKRVALTAIVALLVVALGGLAGAASYDESALIGTWEFDMVKMYKKALEASGQEVPPGMKIEDMVQGSYMRITFEKGGDYSFETRTMGGENTESGTWEVVDKGDDWISVKSVDQKGQEQVVRMTFIDRDNVDALVTDGEQEMTMSATRVTGDKAKKDAGDKDKEEKAE